MASKSTEDIIQSVCITSNNICYGHEPNDSDEVEQQLVISPNGEVSFCARNYQQFRNDEGYRRNKQVNIGTWKADILIWFISNLSGTNRFVSDIGSYEMEIRYESGKKKELSDSLTGDVFTNSYCEGCGVDLTRLIRRFVPIYGLWVFDSSTSPDYEGKKAIYLFADSWEKFFEHPDSIIKFEEEFWRECMRLGFRMDSGERFIHDCKILGCKTPYGEGMYEAVAQIDDIEVIGSGIYSYWRLLTHWYYMYELGMEECGVFLCLLRRLKELTRKK